MIREQDVAGFRAAVLRADDPGALGKWLKSNGYPSPAYVTEWAKPYIERRWVLTAFKVRPDADKMLRTGLVRMTFATDRPFNPYRVPAENAGESPLRLYYLSTGDERPLLGGDRPWVDRAWTAPLDESGRMRLRNALGLAGYGLPEGLRVSAYEDDAFSENGEEDLFFVPVPIYVRFSTVLILGGLAAVVGFFWVNSRRPKAS